MVFRHFLVGVPVTVASSHFSDLRLPNCFESAPKYAGVTEMRRYFIFHCSINVSGNVQLFVPELPPNTFTRKGFAMSLLRSLTSLIVLVIGAFAAIGPVTDLHIVNQNLDPDGFNRPTVLAGGTFPGPLIRGNKVRFITALRRRRLRLT